MEIGSGRVLRKDMTTLGENLQTWKLSSALQKRCRQPSTSTTRKLNVRWKSISTTKSCPSAPSQIPRSNVGQVAHVSPTPWVTSQEADIIRRTPEAACWLRLWCWSNNVANIHPSPGAFNRRVLRSCLVPQCSYPSYRPHHQRCLANCDWMPASFTSGLPSNPRRHPTWWTSSQWSNAVSSTSCHGWSLDSCSTQRSPVHRVQMPGASNRDTHLYPPHNNSSVYLTIRTYVRRTGRITNGMRSGRTTPQDSAFSSPTPAPPPRNDPPKKSLGPA